MSLRKSRGQMYDWVSHVWSPMSGCSHQCSYCYVRKYHTLSEVPVLNEKDFPDLGKGRVIFVGHMTDMYCEAARAGDILRVLEHTRKYPDNEYVFQTKNVGKFPTSANILPPKWIVGTTVETNRTEVVAALSKAPPPLDRTLRLGVIKGKKFLTVEPILDFDVDEFAKMIVEAQPDFVNIGADSKGHGLPEPTKEKIIALVDALGKAGVMIRKKVNLTRLVGDAFGSAVEED